MASDLDKLILQPENEANLSRMEKKVLEKNPNPLVKRRLCHQPTN